MINYTILYIYTRSYLHTVVIFVELKKKKIVKSANNKYYLQKKKNDKQKKKLGDSY